MNKGWSVEAKCPHGKTIVVPLSILQSYGQLLVSCSEAQVERAIADRPLSRTEKKKWRRLKGSFGLTVPNVDSPPSSEIREAP